MFKYFASTTFLEKVLGTQNTNEPARADTYFYFAKANTPKTNSPLFYAECQMQTTMELKSMGYGSSLDMTLMESPSNL